MSALTNNWRCCKCGARLPKGGRGQYGQVWRWRYQKYIRNNTGKENPRSGLYCDSCADARESGMDY